MSHLPRFAVGTVQPDADLCPVLWALLDALHQAETHVQSFQATASLTPVCGIRSITGQSQRHLDSWLMSRATVREIFAHGSRGADLAIVAGRYDSARCPQQKSSLNVLSDWLDLPRVAVVDVRQLPACQRLVLPEGTSALLLDYVRDTADGLRWRVALEALHGTPVIGWLPEAAPLRARLACAAGGPCQDAVRAMGEKLLPSLRLEALLPAVKSRPWNAPAPKLFTRPEGDDRINVAVAFDEAFQGYFADTLDLLEARGARICDFSPLRSEDLPWDTDVVYLAAGKLDRFADALARNHCLKQSLRNFVNQGGRVYAEGGGLAYLCERLVLADGQEFPMTGLLPAIALAKTPLVAPRPVELTFGPRVWLGERGTALRGYADEAWSLIPQPGLMSLAQEPARRGDLVGTQRVIASPLQVDFAGQPHLVASFFRPRRDALVGV
jgi:cobyrinic acid a,c-diamide synthase